jgi:hypothetical protein
MSSTFSIAAEMSSLRYQSTALSLATNIQPASNTPANMASHPPSSTNDFVGISASARDSHHASALEHSGKARDAGKEQRQLDLLRDILRQITGEEPDKLVKGEHRQPQQSPEPQAVVTDAPVSSLTMSASALEVEQFAFSFAGTIATADGKTVSFSMELAVDRASFSNQTLAIADGQNGALAVNYQGSSAELTSSSFSFSLATEGDPINGSGRLLVDDALHDISHAARPLLRDALRQSGMGDMWHEASQMLNAIA